MNSPITGKPMELTKEKRKLVFRKEEFTVVYHYYRCKDTNEQFTTDALDQVNIGQVHNQYREKHAIPFPEQIKQIREKYGVSASKMSEILGLGPNSYRLYENGEIPSVVIGRFIMDIQEPLNFMKQVKASTQLLGEGDTEKILNNAKGILEANTEQWINIKETSLYSQPNEYSGYKATDINKVAQIIDFFNKKIDGELVKTKLNKLLFYADFAHYKLTGIAITGLQYRAIQWGPVPAEYDYLYLKLESEQKIKKELRVYPDGKDAEVFSGITRFEKSDFTESELNVLSEVAKKIGTKKTPAVVNMSHDEQAWIKNEKKKALIDYSYAFELKHL